MDMLIKCGANYAALTPVTFLERAGSVYGGRTSIIYKGISFTWEQTHERCRRLASSLHAFNISKKDVVSVLAPNIPALYEMHFAVPMAGAVLNTINTRLDAGTVATILRHSEAKIFFVDYEYVSLARDALKRLMDAGAPVPLVVVIDDAAEPTGVRLGRLEYEQLVEQGNPAFAAPGVEDEWGPIALNYTSGTTSAPKGVVYSHRGAFLSTLSLLLQWEVGSEPVYLWSLPMFHCNGWTFTWGMAARGGTNVCIRSPCAADIYSAIADHGVTHMCGVPVIFTMLIESKPSERRPIHSPVQVLTGGAPPPAPLLEKVERLGFHVTHAYGLTEATGPATVCEWQAKWDRLPRGDQARLKARQGVSVLSLAQADVKNPETMESVPRDGKTVGEIVLRGSSIMKGYFKNPTGTAEAFKGGWFWTGDVGVIYSDGYVEIKDRSKDVIISGGENISSVEVETVLYGHPVVSEAAVVAMPHPRWGETPCAFLALKEEIGASEMGKFEEEIIGYCRKSLPHYMAPKKVVVMEKLPKTSTGKIQKVQLREMASKLTSTDQSPAKKSQGKSSLSNSRGKQRLESHVPHVLARSRI